MRKDVQCDGIETVDICPIGKVPKLTEENERFRFLLFKALPVLCDGFGGFRHDAIDYVLNMYNVPEEQKPIIYDRFLLVIDAIEEARERERKKK